MGRHGAHRLGSLRRGQILVLGVLAGAFISARGAVLPGIGTTIGGTLLVVAPFWYANTLTTSPD